MDAAGDARESENVRSSQVVNLFFGSLEGLLRILRILGLLLKKLNVLENFKSTCFFQKHTLISKNRRRRIFLKKKKKKRNSTILTFSNSRDAFSRVPNRRVATPELATWDWDRSRKFLLSE